TTCPNSGCGSSVSRKEMLQYIENSGGKNYPFSTAGRVVRTATAEDLAEQARLDEGKRPIIKAAKELIASMRLPMKLVDIEIMLSGDRAILHYSSEQWVDFREMV